MHKEQFQLMSKHIKASPFSSGENLPALLSVLGFSKPPPPPILNRFFVGSQVARLKSQGMREARGSWLVV
jgi:hypothetical protein